MMEMQKTDPSRNENLINKIDGIILDLDNKQKNLNQPEYLKPLLELLLEE